MALSASVVAAYALFVSPSDPGNPFAFSADGLTNVEESFPPFPQDLRGDQVEYHLEGLYFTIGKPWWSTAPYGVAHASAWKAPLYPAWVGLLYGVFGPHPIAVKLAQTLLAALTVYLAWLLARRLFGSRTAIATAFVVALFPLSWEYFGLLYPEALAISATLAVLVTFLGRGFPGRSRQAITGAALGVALLIRPSSVLLLAGIAAAWIVVGGWKGGLAATALAAAVAALVVAPWTIRNAIVTDGGLIPISVQDAAAYGTFNDDSASDPVYPYSWRPVISDMPDVLEGPPVDDATLRSGLQEAAGEYIAEHPFSLAEAFFWNGLSRFWDVRRPARALDEVPFEGRSEPVTAAGIAMYYLIGPLAMLGLWRQRSRRELLWPLLAIALAASVVFTSASGTRYRAPLEPVIVMLAAAAVLAPRPRLTLAADVGSRHADLGRDPDSGA